MTLTFEPFAETVEYLSVNSRIVRQWLATMKRAGTRQVERLLDLATGVGTMVQLFVEGLPRGWQQPLITCVDRSVEALQLAHERLAPRLARPLECLCSAVEHMAVPARWADVILFGNAIHNLDREGQQQVLERVRPALKPGGWFLFNTAFYQEARPGWTLPFYQKKVRLALQKLRELGVSREKQSRRPSAAEFLPRDHYESLVTAHGFELVRVTEVQARLGQQAWELISGYRDYAAGALHGFPPDSAAAALRAAVGPALAEHGRRDDQGMLYIPRNWLAIAARARD